MRAHVLQHASFEGPGSIAAWLALRGARVGYTRFYEWAPVLPELADLDLVIAMGGPMSVNDEAWLPWLASEKRFLRDAIRRGLAVVGVCLGAQLVAAALGARVHRARHREIGWFDVEPWPATARCFRFPGRASVLHWHGETFDLPLGAVRLASSAACENQAFQFGPSVIGLQFHLEATPESATAMIANGRHELVEGRYVQSEAALRGVPADSYTRANTLMDEVLAYVTR